MRDTSQSAVLYSGFTSGICLNLHLRNNLHKQNVCIFWALSYYRPILDITSFFLKMYLNNAYVKDNTKLTPSKIKVRALTFSAVIVSLCTDEGTV